MDRRNFLTLAGLTSGAVLTSTYAVLTGTSAAQATTHATLPYASNPYVPDNGHNNYFWGAGQVLGSSISLGRTPQPGDLVNGTRMFVVACAMTKSKVIPAVPIGDNLSLSKLLPAVKAFQSQQKLYVDGFIGAKTFAAANRVLGTAYDWQMDGYIQDTLPAAVHGSRQQRVAAMAQYFSWFENTSPYVWGGMGYVSGPTRQTIQTEIGFDCSGLVYQMLAAGGIVLDSTDPVRHAQEAFRSTQAIYADPRLRSVPLASRQNGDIVTFTDKSGVIKHNGVFFNNTLLEAATTPIRRVAWNGGLLRTDRYPLPFVKRAFI